MGSEAREFVALVGGLIDSSLERCGFRTRGSGAYVRALPGSDGVRGYAGVTQLDPGPFGVHDVLVFVGVEQPDFRELYARLVPGAVSDGAAQNLAELLPGRQPQSWRFDPRHDNAATAAELATAVCTFGVPFMERLADPSEFASFVKEKEPSAQAAFRVPVVLLMTGDVEDATRIVRTTLESLPEHGHWAEFYREFAERFFAYLGDTDAPGSDPPDAAERSTRR